MNKTIEVSPEHKEYDQLHQELESAKKEVIIGGIYSHYKHPENTYKVLYLGFTEVDDSVCVIYQATYNQELIFVRPLKSWLETLDWNGGKVLRFSLVDRY